MRGIDAVLEVLHASGVHYIFGNPGSTELPLNDALATDFVDPEIDFVSLARALGVEAHRVPEPDELCQRVGDGLDRTRPLLLDVEIER